ncbi:MAG: hypothetical protein ACM3S3_02760 [Candidatus Doudnabacteria bacterium]
MLIFQSGGEVEQHQLHVVGRREPDDVGGRVGGGQGGDAGVARAGGGQLQDCLLDIGFLRHEAGDDQIRPLALGERGRDRQERAAARRHCKERPRLLRRSAQVERRVLREDRTLELAQGWSRLDAELFDQRLTRSSVGVEGL